MASSTLEALALLGTIERQIRKGEFSVRNASLMKTNDRGPQGMRLVLDFTVEPRAGAVSTATVTTVRDYYKAPPGTGAAVREYEMPGELAAALKKPKPQPMQPFGSRDLDID